MTVARPLPELSYPTGFAAKLPIGIAAKLTAQSNSHIEPREDGLAVIAIRLMHSCWEQPLYQAKDTHSPEDLQDGLSPLPPTMWVLRSRAKQGALSSGAKAALG